MALKATIYKLSLSVSDINRNYYHDHELTIARHPSETEQRLLARILAFCLYADKSLCFTKGLCVENEPELWLKNFSDEIELWIDLGQPDVKRIKKATSKAKNVVVLCYAENKSQQWWQLNKNTLAAYTNLTVVNFKPEDINHLQQILSRNMSMQCVIQDDLLTISDKQQSVFLQPEYWLLSQ